jgi:hypothetical protein
MMSSRSVAAFVLALVAAAILAVIGTTPPSPVPADAPPGVFSAERAMRDVEAIAAVPHASGTQEIALVRAHLVSRLAGMGLQVRTQGTAFDAKTTDALNRRSGRNAASIPLVNVIGILPGKDRTLPAVALMAHYDSVWGSPGAADDAAGVAAILETVRVLARELGRTRDLVIVLTDGEEAGLSGAEAYFGQPAQANRIGAIINLEARGGGGSTNLFQTSPGGGNLVRLWAGSTESPGGASMATFIYSILPNDTDLSVPLRQGGYAAWNFAFIGRPAQYHSPMATPENLDRGSLQHMGEQVLGLSRALLAEPDLPAQAPDVVFFDVFGLFVVHYAPVWGWAMLAVAMAGYGLAARRSLSWKSLGRGGLRMTGLIAVGALVLTVLNLLSGADGDTNYYDRLAAIPRLQAMAALAGTALAVAVLGRRPECAAGYAGAALPLFVFALAAQIAAPVAAYVLIVPLLLGGLGMAVPANRRPAMAVLVRAGAAALGGGLQLVLGYQLLQAVGPTLPAVAVIPLSLLALLLLPLRPNIDPKAGWAASGLLLLAAGGIALWVRWDATAQSIATYS